LRHPLEEFIQVYVLTAVNPLASRVDLGVRFDRIERKTVIGLWQNESANLAGEATPNWSTVRHAADGLTT
jgi:hypothetical protein